MTTTSGRGLSLLSNLWVAVFLPSKECREFRDLVPGTENDAKTTC